jgi:hypothetical protein
MTTEAALQALWLDVRQRLAARQLLLPPEASMSLRIPGTDSMWFGGADDVMPRRLDWRHAGALTGAVALHAAVYGLRGDASAIASGGGPFGACLGHFGGALPQVFDEQARHIGPMRGPASHAQGLHAALRGGGNAVMVDGRPVCLGMTASRLALNAELFEKCAKAYVLAAAAGGPIKPLPWIVRAVANRRLRKDQGRARQRLALGQLPEETKGY